MGALDGMHCKLSPPPHSGCLYFNYKKLFSIILLAFMKANYEFLWVNIGANGVCSHAHIYNGSSLSEAIETRAIQWPVVDPLGQYNNDRRIAYFIIGDDSFALKPWLLKPYLKHAASARRLTHREKGYNYHISRG